jgi:hypothetical protein
MTAPFFFVPELPNSDRGKALRDKLRAEWVRLTAS